MFLTQLCLGQADTSKKEKQVYNKDFKWRITIPANFESISDEQYAQLQQKGTDALQKEAGEKIENNSVRIFAFRSDRFHYFESNSQPFDAATDGDFYSVCKGVDGMVFNTFKNQIPATAKIDSTLSTETIDNLTFQRFQLKITINNTVLNLLLYNRLFDKKELTVTIFYVDQSQGDQLLTAWRNSKFEKD